MASDGCGAPALPMINLSGLELSASGTDEWAAARSQVMNALETYGSFEAEFDKVDLELREAVFGSLAKQLFGLPLETKLKNSSNKPHRGYIGQMPGFPYESLAIEDASSLEHLRRFCSVMWPGGGNPDFCKTMWEFAKLLAELEQIVTRMILESLCVEHYFESAVKNTTRGLRLSEYGPVRGDGSAMRLDVHKDPNLITIVGQHEIFGLEMRTKQGDWIRVAPTPHSFTVMLGDSFEASGPVSSRADDDWEGDRYSSVFGSFPADDSLVRVPDELVDEEHPLRFKPYRYLDYTKFKYSEPGRQAKDPLIAFCGI